MIVLPNTSNNRFGLKLQETKSHYSNLSFILEYIKDGLFDFLFPEGKDSFAEILTTYSQPELRPYMFPKENGDRPENERKFTDKGLTAIINLVQNFEMNNRNGMSNLPFSSTMNDPLESNYFVFRDNLLTLSYVPMFYKFNIDLAIRHPNKVLTYDIANFLYSRIHMGKKFFLSRDINLKHLLDEELILLLRLLYAEETEEEFNVRLNTITDGNIYDELDRTTGNNRTVIDLRTRPIVTINSIDNPEDGINISIELEVPLPSKFWMSSIYSAEELNSSLVKNFELLPVENMSDEDKEKLVNFDIAFIEANRSLFPEVTDEILSDIIHGKIIPVASLNNLDRSTIDKIGLNNPGLQQIQNINMSLNLPVNNTYVNTVEKRRPVIEDSSVTYDKVKTIIVNRITSTTDNSNEIRISDDVFCSVFKNTEIETKILVRRNNNEAKDYTVNINNDGTVSILFTSKVTGFIYTIELYRERNV